MTDEQVVREFLEKKLGRKLKAADWTAMGVKTDEQIRQQLRPPKKKYAKDAANIMPSRPHGQTELKFVAELAETFTDAKGQRWTPLYRSMWQAYESAATQQERLIRAENDRLQRLADQEAKSDAGRLKAVLKDGPVRFSELRTATDLSRNKLIAAGKALGVRKRKHGVGANSHWTWELPKSPVST